MAKLAFLPGVFNGVALALLTIGIQWTTVTKSSFLTTLYIVFIPTFDWIFFRTRIRWLVIGCLIAALYGAILITRIEYGDWNSGDLLTLLCAVVASFQILYIDKMSEKITRPFVFNTFQSLYGGLVALPFALTLENFSLPITATPWLGIAFLSLGVCIVAFTIQIRSQKILPSTTVSMFFLLESPIATFFAWLFFQEVMGWDQVLGALLILAAAFGTIMKRSEPPASPASA